MSNERIIAYFDILGYKELVEKAEIEDVREKMYSLLDKVKGLTENPLITMYAQSELDYIIFSDSIIIYTEEISFKSFMSICFASNVLLYFSFLEGIPLRGAVSHGEFYVDKKENVFFGKALINAYLLEGKQKWAGACIDEKTIKYFFDIDSKKMNAITEKLNYLFRYNIPTGYIPKDVEEFRFYKDGSLQRFKNVEIQVINNYVLNWVMVEEILNIIDNSHVIESDQMLLELFLLADIFELEKNNDLDKTTPLDVLVKKELGIQFKIVNTINFYHYSKENKKFDFSQIIK